ncbi:hypothetical protein FA048_14750 [Pedobacter polaris]|uniref:PD(D/E)XK endonuclease domain-containing protein n=1 Tax=Pedobacter polaris TaxID=2571273 RepID=A0A4U1CME4_9SPHI|nr:group I intron-associated PD-(D/E)XK endonuclease [Pedobacter polaris]TKC06473.1 hypothetical protein FA048_14750 [Pedobacter polaris]
MSGTLKKIYIKQNINAINASNFILDEAGMVLFRSIQNLKDYMDKIFSSRLIYEKGFQQKLLLHLSNENYRKNRIERIANNNLIRTSSLIAFYEKNVLQSLGSNISKSEYIEYCMKYFKETVENNKFRFIRTNLKKTLNKQYDFIYSRGYPENELNINTGTMSANAGDSAQFLFISRAILLGFNCSNVDVRSSRYDAIIDFNGRLLRIQVKGVSGDVISFKDRDRGGQGIDHRAETNLGKKISSTDCDIYVAVDRRFGTCYIIPVKEFIDPLLLENGVIINLSLIEKYKEDWNVFETVVKSIFKT